MSAERLAVLARRLDSYTNSTSGFLEDVTKAQANVEQLKSFKERASGLDVFDDPALVGIAAVELSQLEEEVEQFIEGAFFAGPEEDEPSELPALPDDTTYRDHPIVWRLGSLDLRHPKDWPTCETAAVLGDLLAKLKGLESFTWRKLITDHSEHTHEWEDGELSDWEAASLRRLDRHRRELRSVKGEPRTANILVVITTVLAP